MDSKRAWGIRWVATAAAATVLVLGCGESTTARTGDHAGAGGSAGVGGATAGGSGAPTSEGGPGSPSGEGQPACLEEPEVIDGATPTEIGVSAFDAIELVGGLHRADLQGPSPRPSLELTLVDMSVAFVRSESNPSYPLDIFVACQNHVRVQGTAIVRSGTDLDETIADFELDIAEPGTATGVVSIRAEDLHGAYAPDYGPGTCFSALQLDVTITDTRFSGDWLDTVAAAECDGIQPTTGVSPRTHAMFDAANGPCTAVQGGLYDTAGACFGPMETIGGVCLRELVPDGTMGTGETVCLVGPEGQTYLVPYGYTQTLAANGWHVEFVTGGSGSPLESFDVTTASCEQAFANMPPDDGLSLSPPPVAGTCP